MSVSRENPDGLPVHMEEFPSPSFATIAQNFRDNTDEDGVIVTDEVKAKRREFIETVKTRLANASVDTVYEGHKGIFFKPLTLAYCDHTKNRVRAARIRDIREAESCTEEELVRTCVPFVHAIPVTHEEVASVGSKWLAKRFNYGYGKVGISPSEKTKNVVLFPASITREDYHYLRKVAPQLRKYDIIV